eukprot:TRINITY_DN21879_c0_g1_i1.p1 TRINITY_DN21879_c0_g1~~TRINITY_DN21879_c0_g1_i1.p1  ORF type:complete len:578 (+),score=144.74 TRINITY_DN21879_c0_g1_i1:59-1792(+)
MTENAVRELTKANQELASRVQLLENYLRDAEGELLVLRAANEKVPKAGECTAGCLAAAERDVLWSKLRECNESKKELKKEYRNRIFEQELEIERLRGFTATPPPPPPPPPVEYCNAETQLSTPLTHEKPLRVLSNPMQVEPQSLFTTNGYEQMEVPAAVSLKRADSPELPSARYSDTAVDTPDTVQTTVPPTTSNHRSPPSRQVLLGRLEAAHQWGDNSAVKEIEETLKMTKVSTPNEVLDSNGHQTEPNNRLAVTMGSTFIKTEADKYLCTKVANTEALLQASEERNRSLADEVVELRYQLQENASNEEIHRKMSQQLRRELDIAVRSKSRIQSDDSNNQQTQSRNITPPRRHSHHVGFTSPDELTSPVLVSQHKSPIKENDAPFVGINNVVHPELQRTGANTNTNKPLLGSVSRPVVLSPQREKGTAAIKSHPLSAVQLVPQKQKPSQQQQQQEQNLADKYTDTSDSRSSSINKQVVISTSSVTAFDRRASVSLRGDGSSIRVSPQKRPRKPAAYHNYSGNEERSRSSSVSVTDSELLLDTSTQHFNDSVVNQLNHFKPRKGRESNGPYISSKRF